MSRDLAINVNVNPNGVASPTQTRTTETPQSKEIEQRTTKNNIATTAIISIAQRGISAAASNIGQVTGNRSAARKAAAIGRLVTLTYAASVNPLAAGFLFATQFANQQLQTGLENRSVANEAEYNRILRTANYNNGRK